MNVYEFRERATSGVDDATEELATRVIGVLIDVHSVLRPGMPEIAYRNAVAIELGLKGIACEIEKPVPILYKGHEVGRGLIDVLVDHRLVLELKAVEALTEVHRCQVVTYLQALSLLLGLLVNFNVVRLKQGLKRVINTFDPLRVPSHTS